MKSASDFNLCAECSGGSEGYICPACALNEIKRLRAIVDKLPKTKDGVRFTPDMIVFARMACGLIWYSSGEFRRQLDWRVREVNETSDGTYRIEVKKGCSGHELVDVAIFNYKYGVGVPISECYSTHEAAEGSQ